jgi:hypothetical protein
LPIAAGALELRSLGLSGDLNAIYDEAGIEANKH